MLGIEGYVHVIKHFFSNSIMSNGFQGIVKPLPGQGVILSAVTIDPSLEHVCAACVEIVQCFSLVAFQVIFLAEFNSKFMPLSMDFTDDSMMAKNFQGGFT